MSGMPRSFAAHCITSASAGVFPTVVPAMSPAEVKASKGTVVSLSGPEYLYIDTEQKSHQPSA